MRDADSFGRVDWGGGPIGGPFARRDGQSWDVMGARADLGGLMCTLELALMLVSTCVRARASVYACVYAHVRTCAWGRSIAS